MDLFWGMNGFYSMERDIKFAGKNGGPRDILLRHSIESEKPAYALKILVGRQLDCQIKGILPTRFTHNMAKELQTAFTRSHNVGLNEHGSDIISMLFHQSIAKHPSPNVVTA